MKTLPVELPMAELSNLCRKHSIRWMALFGSVLGPQFNDRSDIDMLVEFLPGRVPGLKFYAIQSELGQLLGRSVDLHTPRSLSADFREAVLQEAETIYGTR